MENKIIKLKTIYQDQRIAEEFCNFRCDYCEGFCPSDYSLIKDKYGNLKVADEWYEKIELMPDKVRSYFSQGRKMEDFYNLALEIMKKTKKVLYADILKISGGEITTNQQLLNFIKQIHKQYFSIQILTNGFNLTKDEIDEYKKMKNVNFQISIDGVTPESNYAKTHNSKITERVLENIEYIIKKGIGLEINCVLTKYNTDKFLPFLEKFSKANNFIIIPRPVRGKPKDILSPSREQILNFEKMLIEHYEMYSNILPPKAYIYRLIEIMKDGKRSTKCYIPFFVQSIDGYGNLEECPIGLITASQINIFNFQNNKDIKYQIFKDVNLCQNCTNQYEMFNLYIENKITKEELKKMPSLNSNKIIRNIDNIKENVVKFEINKILKEKYNIIAKKIEKSEQSTDGNVYIIYCNDKKYITKIYKDLNHTQSMINLHRKLASLKINIPHLISNKDKNGFEKIFDTSYLVVYSYINGQPIGWDAKTGKLNKNIVISIAKELKKIHKTTEKNEFNLSEVPFLNKEERQSVLHFDLTRNNIFIDDDNKISFIDFDDAKYGSSVCDIAILISNLFFSKTRGVDLDGMQVFIDEYYRNEEKLKKKEIPLIKEYALQWINYILQGNIFDTSTTESFEIRKKLILENL